VSCSFVLLSRSYIDDAMGVFVSILFGNHSQRIGLRGSSHSYLGETPSDCRGEEILVQPPSFIRHPASISDEEVSVNGKLLPSIGASTIVVHYLRRYGIEQKQRVQSGVRRKSWKGDFNRCITFSSRRLNILPS
jgi:hypothetical protein